MIMLFSARCAKCQDLFSPDDFVMRAKNQIFHLKCFQCLCCGKQLVQGDEFALKNDKIFCKHCADLEAFDERFEEIPERNNNKRDNYRHADHYQHLFAEMASKAHTQECASSTTSEGLKSFKEESGEEKELFDFDDEDEDNSSDMKFNGRDMKRSSVDERIEGTPDSHSSSDGTLKSPALGEDQQHQVRRGRAGRVRTVLTEKQLNMLKSCYQVNKRPDALVKEQLVELTGLSPRVVRVWFQNKRCKDKKKMALLQEKESQKHGYGSMHGIPMVASNPVINDTSLIPAMANQPVDVQHFEAPWKSLYDFASNLDPDKIGRYPPFQPLSQQIHGIDMSINGGAPPHSYHGHVYQDARSSDFHGPTDLSYLPASTSNSFPSGFLPEDPMASRSMPMSEHSVESATNYTLTSLDSATSPVGSET
ncbi:insulin gene enhancer protein ISL-3-like isoform X2 [Tigriopus californicus]|uniref:insulin gene enhancer protein ISL-3-like isoform X2 n=1 Tax=Tigriopus californicus TaxID=6832 RepID=UPI0027DA115D|nr:insulin gene enhancer protein ISL-3-like isoform X2 [Tigriopus californicus]